MSSPRSNWIGIGVVALGLLAAALWLGQRPEPETREAAPVAALPTAPAPVSEPAVAAAEAQARLELSLRLIGTTVAEDPARHRAVIVDFAQDRRQVVRIDDRLLDYEAVYVREIETLRVRLDVEGEVRWLHLDLETPVEPAAYRMPVEWWTELADKDSGELTEAEREELMLEGIKKMWRMQLGRREPELQPQQGIFAPWEEDGEFVGIFASRIIQGGLFDQLGLEPFDIVHDVNGVPVRSPDDTLELMQRFAHDSQIRIHLTRDGEPVTIESHLAPQILEDLGVPDDVPEPS